MSNTISTVEIFYNTRYNYFMDSFMRIIKNYTNSLLLVLLISIDAHRDSVFVELNCSDNLS